MNTMKNTLKGDYEMKVDLYTKTILSIIAIVLWAMLLKPIFISDIVNASNVVLDVNIKEIDGKKVYGSLDVNIEKVNGRTFTGSSLPVTIKK
jgi:5,10-methylene-tetrahydrofolate dehydrogenase/methenyl tetrahydrofolate cyclohydrolase